MDAGTQKVPSGKHTKTMEHHHFSWESYGKLTSFRLGHGFKSQPLAITRGCHEMLPMEQLAAVCCTNSIAPRITEAEGRFTNIEMAPHLYLSNQTSSNLAMERSDLKHWCMTQHIHMSMSRAFASICHPKPTRGQIGSFIPALDEIIRFIQVLVQSENRHHNYLKSQRDCSEQILSDLVPSCC